MEYVRKPKYRSVVRRMKPINRNDKAAKILALNLLLRWWVAHTGHPPHMADQKCYHGRLPRRFRNWVSRSARVHPTSHSSPSTEQRDLPHPIFPE